MPSDLFELPLLSCAMGSRYSQAIGRARAAFERLMRAHVRRVRLTGVIFFDRVRGQAGGAANGVEIHPVLKVEAIP